MQEKFKIILDGFDTKEQAIGFLRWFEGQGEQDDTIGEWLGDSVTGISVKIGSLKELIDGAQYDIEVEYSE